MLGLKRSQNRLSFNSRCKIFKLLASNNVYLAWRATLIRVSHNTALMILNLSNHTCRDVSIVVYNKEKLLQPSIMSQLTPGAIMDILDGKNPEAPRVQVLVRIFLLRNGAFQRIPCCYCGTYFNIFLVITECISMYSFFITECILHYSLIFRNALQRTPRSYDTSSYKAKWYLKVMKDLWHPCSILTVIWTHSASYSSSFENVFGVFLVLFFIFSAFSIFRICVLAYFDLARIGSRSRRSKVQTPIRRSQTATDSIYRTAHIDNHVMLPSASLRYSKLRTMFQYIYHMVLCHWNICKTPNSHLPATFVDWKIHVISQSSCASSLCWRVVLDFCIPGMIVFSYNIVVSVMEQSSKRIIAETVIWVNWFSKRTRRSYFSY